MVLGTSVRSAGPPNLTQMASHPARDRYLELANATPVWVGTPYWRLDSPAMGLLTLSLNITLDGCVDHREGIADDETHAFYTRLMDEAGAMLWGRATYELMESYWPAVARGAE